MIPLVDLGVLRTRFQSTTLLASSSMGVTTIPVVHNSNGVGESRGDKDEGFKTSTLASKAINMLGHTAQQAKWSLEKGGKSTITSTRLPRAAINKLRSAKRLASAQTMLWLVFAKLHGGFHRGLAEVRRDKELGVDNRFRNRSFWATLASTSRYFMMSVCLWEWCHGGILSLCSSEWWLAIQRWSIKWGLQVMMWYTRWVDKPSCPVGSINSRSMLNAS